MVVTNMKELCAYAKAQRKIKAGEQTRQESLAKE